MASSSRPPSGGLGGTEPSVSVEAEVPEALFIDLKDSPMFQKRVNELVSAHEASLGRIQVLVDAGTRYARALETTYQASHAFADAVESFNEQDGKYQTVPMTRLVQSMREVSSFVELLRTQVELILCEGLGSWADEDHQRIQDLSKQAKARKSEYDAARGRYMNKVGDDKGSRAEKKEIAKLKQLVSDEARLGFARALVQSRERASIEVMTSIASVMHAQKKYFEHGCTAGTAVDPHVDDILRHAGELGLDLERNMERFDEMIEYEMDRDEVDTVPVQGELEALIQQSFRSNHRTVTILKQGFLLKRSSKRNKWDLRYFVLDSSGILYYYSSKAVDGGKASANERRMGTPTATVNLVTAAVKPGLDVAQGGNEKQVPFAFRIVSPERDFVLRAEDKDEAAAWMEVLQSVILCLLSGAYQTSEKTSYIREHLQKNVSPMKPTHSRDASQDLSRVMAAMEMEEAAGVDEEHQFKLRLLELSAKSCADCGASPADWASINLVAPLCIECSGIHRKLGVHVSKVRSCSLDTKVWDDAMLSMFERLGSAVNSVWEARLAFLPDEKPQSTSSPETKEVFVTKKYKEKAFISLEAAERRKDQAQVSKDLWSAIEMGDVNDVYEALSILDDRPTSSDNKANELYALIDGAGGKAERCFVHGEDARFRPTHLHLAAMQGDQDVLSLLLLAGKFDIDEVDASGRSALVYSLWFDNADAAKLLLKHGARLSPDFTGSTPLQILRGRGEHSLRCNSDPGLLELLI